MKPSALLILWLVTASACASERSRWQTDERVLSCTPATVQLGEAIDVRLGPNHGQELSIGRVRDKTTFFLVVGGAPEGFSTLMTTEEFSKARHLLLSTALEATPWEPPFNQPKVRVFDKPGIYWLFVSTNLESEAGGYRCKVTVASGRK